jgi:hypothetical protein
MKLHEEMKLTKPENKKPGKNREETKKKNRKKDRG